MRKSCVAFKQDKVSQFPAKKIKTKIKNRYFDYFIISHNGSVFLKKRTAPDIWKSLYDFPLVESRRHRPLRSLMRNVYAEEILKGVNSSAISGSRVYRHKLSHQTLNVRFWKVSITQNDPEIKVPGTIKASRKSLYRFPFPKLIEKFVNEHVI
jgi:A/G-specific adenine glycosylase